MADSFIICLHHNEELLEKVDSFLPATCSICSILPGTTAASQQLAFFFLQRILFSKITFSFTSKLASSFLICSFLSSVVLYLLGDTKDSYLLIINYAYNRFIITLSFRTAIYHNYRVHNSVAKTTP